MKISVKQLLREANGFPKGQYVMIADPKQKKTHSKQLYNLIQTAYKPIGGHVKFKSEMDVLNPEVNFWMAADLDADPEIDVTTFGKKTKFGIKHTGLGHDGNKANIKSLLTTKTKELKKPGNYIEVSGKAFDAFVVRGNVPIVDDEETVRKVLGKKANTMTWHGKHPTDKSKKGNGWYSRTLAGHAHVKIMAGIPKV